MHVCILFSFNMFFLSPKRKENFKKEKFCFLLTCFFFHKKEKKKM